MQLLMGGRSLSGVQLANSPCGGFYTVLLTFSYQWHLLGGQRASAPQLDKFV